jgi:2'-5' RNA ligase
MRLFVAIELADEARDALAAEQRRLQLECASANRPGLKWLASDRIHLTLVFIGEVDAERAVAIGETFGQPLDVGPFSIAFGGLGMFPPHGAPRVLWVGLLRGARSVIDVQYEMAKRLGRLGIVLEERGFHPHLTLARWRESRTSDRRRIADADRHVPIAAMDVDSISLIQSRLSSRGPDYTTLCRLPLQESAPPPLQSTR